MKGVSLSIFCISGKALEPPLPAIVPRSKLPRAQTTSPRCQTIYILKTRETTAEDGRWKSIRTPWQILNNGIIALVIAVIYCRINNASKTEISEYKSTRRLKDAVQNLLQLRQCPKQHSLLMTSQLTTSSKRLTTVFVLEFWSKAKEPHANSCFCLPLSECASSKMERRPGALFPSFAASPPYNVKEQLIYLAKVRKKFPM